jgi:hypothetical protein
MTNNLTQYRSDLRTVLSQRDYTLETWSVHVDELTQWCPLSDSFEHWLEPLCLIYEEACALLVNDSVVVALTLNPTSQLDTFNSMSTLIVDFFTPPSLYVLKAGLSFPLSGEQYYRVVPHNEIAANANMIKAGRCIVRSARSLQALERGWEFDNTLYIASKFTTL